jgi:RNA polymerase sigma factor (sigma-70 family)
LGIPENDRSDEDELLKGIGSDPRAFHELYETFFPRVYNYFRLRTAERGLADDLTAMTFEQAWMGMRKFHLDSGSFENWLFSIAQNLVNEHLDFQRHHQDMEMKALSSRPENEPPVMQKKELAELLKAVEGLEEQPRELIALKFAARMTDPQIAAISGLSEGEVRIILYRALERLWSTLEEDEHHDEGLKNESEWSERIDLDLRILMNDAEPPKGFEPPKEISHILEVARRLTQADLSHESMVRESLGERLAAHPPGRRWSWGSPGGLAHLLSPLQAVALALVAILLILTLIILINGSH